MRRLRFEPAALAAERLHELVGRQRRLGLEHVLDRGAAARAASSVQIAVVLMRLNLPPRPTATIRRGALDVDERHVGPVEALQRRVDAEARARAAADRVDPRQVPVLQVVVAELGVVRDVREVGEDLLARTVDRDVARDGVHGGREA